MTEKREQDNFIMLPTNDFCFKELKKCMHVSILDFDHFHDDGRCYRTISLCDEETGKPYSSSVRKTSKSCSKK